MSAALFDQFHRNLSVKNEEEISGRYCAITKRLNKDYWDVDSEYVHCLQVGSYGRNTAIDGISDLDMVFELPWSVHNRFCERQGNVQSALLSDVREKLKVLYPRTDISADGQVVVVQFTNYCVEVLPAFLEADGSYKYPDSNNGGTWKWCWPRDEISAVQQIHDRSNSNLKRVCKMLRAWKNHTGVPMSGMLIDTLCHNFFKDNSAYDDKAFAAYPDLMREVFAYLGDLPDQVYWLAPGSKDRVYPTGSFQNKAKKAAATCQDALSADKDRAKENHWRSVFGRPFPRSAISEAAATFRRPAAPSTEEFIEDKFPVDVQYEVRIECDVKYNGANELKMRWLESIFPLRLGRSLRFHVAHCTVAGPFQVFWKIRNVGSVAQKQGVRGQIIPDEGKLERFEKTDFPGPHFVECYVVKDGCCVARDRIEVPIGQFQGLLVDED